MMTGKEALVRMLMAEGVDHIFGNPGTSETPMMDALQDFPEVNYIQALQEGTAVGMADGYARATGRPAFANIHIAGGLANGISALYNAYRGGTPVVLTAGNSDTRMLLSEPTLSGDLVQMTRQYTKWSHEIHHAADIPAAVRRAFNEAKTPPTGADFPVLPVGHDGRAGRRGHHRVEPGLSPHPARPRCVGAGIETADAGREPGHDHRRPHRPIRWGGADGAGR